MTRFRIAFAGGFAAAIALAAIPAQAQEYRCCNVPKKDWLPGLYSEAACIAKPRHEPEMQGYEKWKSCVQSSRVPPEPPGVPPEDGDPPKDGGGHTQ